MHIVTYMCYVLLLDGVLIGWLDLLHLYTQPVTTSNYNTFADFHIKDHWDTPSLLSLH
jgi:hypothetical protein